MIPQTERLASWDRLTIEDMAFAYRKAKADCFFDRSLPICRSFAAYEENLEVNLGAMLERLRSEDRWSVVRDEHMLGEQCLVPKRLSLKMTGKASHVYFSNPNRAADYLQDCATACAEFRVASKFPVDAYVLSALWVNRIGHRFDACLHDVAFGARVRRYGGVDKRVGPYHIKAVSTFGPYVWPYRRWREGGLAAVKGALGREERLAIVTTDFKDYYHLIDPGFIREASFWAHLGLQPRGEGEDGDPTAGLSAVEEELTSMLIDWLQGWAKRAAELMGNPADAGKGVPLGGLPIGVTAARIIANVLLAPFDKAILESLTPIYYGRYVDDIFLVLRDGGGTSTAADVMRLIAGRLPPGMLKERPGEELEVRIEGQGRSELVLQNEKHRVFFLEGQAGLDLLGVIRREITDLSSERRLMPDPEALTDSVASRALTAMGDSREATDALRKADGLSIKRLGWSVQLSAAETLTVDLPPPEWQSIRRSLYHFAEDHVLRSDAILDHLNYFPRLLGLALECQDWRDATHLIRTAEEALQRLQGLVLSGGLKLNGTKVKGDDKRLWAMARATFRDLIQDAVVRSWPFVGGQPVRNVDELASLKLLAVVGLTEEDTLDESVRLREMDLARVPLKEHRKEHGVSAWMRPQVDAEVARLLWPEANNLRGFLTKTAPRRVRSDQIENESLVPCMFPTRPYSVREIAELDPRCVDSGADGPDSGVELWGRWARAVRGIWTRERNDAKQPPTMSKNDVTVLTLGRGCDRRVPRVGVSSLQVAESCWHAAAADKPDLSLSRYQQLAQIVNSVLKMNPRPQYLLLPELAVPRRWVNSIANRLLASKISLIAGVEYEHEPPDLVTNRAVLALTDNRLGFESSVMWWHKKGQPAPTEEQDLKQLHGRRWSPSRVSDQSNSRDSVVVYRHFGFEFGLLLCSELQEIAFRHQYQGEVDALFILSWNKDLDTFGSLVEAAALDVHAYTGIVNNRLFGDSRVRVPAKDHYRRDLCRLQGGLNDFVTVVELDVGALRRFQSRAKNTPRPGDAFKPVPQGFVIAPRRREIPGAPNTATTEE